MSEEPEIEIGTGDIIRHIPSGEKWVVAYCERGRVCCCGWPETLAKREDCELRRKAEPHEVERILNEMKKLRDSRGEYARRTLAAKVVDA